MKTERRSTRSALALARKALQIASAAFPAYASPYSKKTFTQGQLFATLCLKQFLRQDFRGLAAMLKDWSDLREALKLKKAPHYSTPAKAALRLCKNCHFQRLWAAVFEDAGRLKLVGEKPEVAVDATGFESRYCSRYFLWRQGKRHRRQRWPKLTMAVHTQSHLIAGAFATIGPSQDSPQFGPVTRQAARHLGTIDRLLGDAGYDAEHNHRLARERLKIRNTVIALNRRGTGRKWPKTRYRRQMKRCFHRRKYRQRWQIESVNSRIKRRLGSALSGRSNKSRRTESLLRALTHNLTILRLQGFQQSKMCSRVFAARMA